MRRRLFTVVVLLSFTVSRAPAQSRGAVDWIFLVDTSASMRGAGGMKDIFDEVKASIRTFVTEATDGDSVAIFAFDRDVRLHSVMTIGGSARAVLHKNVDALKADGNRTYLGLAIAEGLRHARESGRDPRRVRAVVLFTDGKEDTKGIKNPVPILANVDQVGDSHVFFVSMGEHEPQLDAFVKGTPRSQVLRAPSSEAIARVAQQIRKIVDPPPPPLRVEVSPESIAFGSVRIGEAAEERTLTIRANRNARVKVKVETPQGVTIRAVDAVDVGPEKHATVKLQAAVADDAAPGPKSATITAHNAKATATLEVVEPPLALRIAKIAIPIAILAAIAVALVASHRRKNRLEGELEILEPRLAADAAYVGLPQLQTSEIALSTLVPLDALGGQDARLFVRRRNGQKKVWIA